MSTLKTNNIEHLDATSPSIEVNAAGGIQVGGALTATTGTFSGNVSIAGVLTYEDVTNIDSVGIITAQSGVNVTGGTFQLGNSSGSNVIIAQNTGIDINDGQLNLYTATSNVNAAPFIVSTDVGGIETEKFRITAGGSVGINTNAPDKLLTVFTDSNSGYSTATNSTPSGQSLIKLFNKNGTDNTGVDNYSAIEFGIANGATSQGWLGYTRTGNNQGAFFVKQRNAASSYPETIRFPSSGGVTFGGGANDANTLDDYEEGTFVPTVTGLTNGNVMTLDSTIETMRYIKVGRKVTLFGRFRISSTNSATGSIQLGAFPFTSDNTGPDQSSFNALQLVLHGFSLPANASGVVFAEFQGNQTHANVYCTRDNDSWTNLNSSNVNTAGGAYMYITGSYYANS